MVWPMIAGLCRWASYVGASLWVLTSVSLGHADVPISENATRRFEEGVRHLRTQEPDRYEKAYREFKAAYADSPSWKILGNLGIVAQQLERDGEAIDAFKGYLEGGGNELSEEERKQFTSDLRLLESGHCSVTIHATPAGAWIIDEHLPEVGSPVLNRYGPTSGPLELRVRAGHHRLTAELSGYTSEPWEFTEEAGTSSFHLFELRRTHVPSETPAAPKPEPFNDRLHASHRPSDLRIASYVAFGLGAVGLGAGTWFYVDSRDQRDAADEVFATCQADSDCRATPSQMVQTELDRRENAEGNALTRSLVSFSAGGAFIVTGVILFVLSSGNDGNIPEQTAITPWITPRELGLSGRF